MKFDKLHEALTEIEVDFKKEVKKMNAEKMIKVMKSLKIGDTIEIEPVKGKPRKMKVMNVYDPKFKKVHISSGRKRSMRQQMDGSVSVWDEKTIVWQPTMLTQVADVKSLKKL